MLNDFVFTVGFFCNDIYVNIQIYPKIKKNQNFYCKF